MDINALLSTMTPEIYERMRQAVETGKWPDGKALTEEQRDNSLQLVLLYQSKVLKSAEHMTIGEDGNIVQKSRQQLKQEMGLDKPDPNTIARFKQDDI
ncbi:YeaC family protein [Aestuariibacter salexigens]|uniref:YeaC family protein n=1 Tax=Aestuariibacter salexigens TaxID=226010 RepID=UPI0004053FE6|nr:DUF1315 family protein [Aestuariibacter salexigens]